MVIEEAKAGKQNQEVKMNAVLPKIMDEPKKGRINSKSMTPQISVILPTLNEEKAIQKVIDEIPYNDLPNTEVVVIDGNSKDNTRQIAQQCGARVILESREGYGQAIHTGFNNVNGDIIVWMDSDYTYPAYQIPKLIQPILDNKADIVLGTRIKGNIHPGAMKHSHRFGNILLTLIFNILFLRRLSDTQTGLRAFHKSVLKKLKFSNSGMAFATQTLIQAVKKRLRIKEVKIDYRPRIGTSKLSAIKDGARIFAEIVTGFFR